MWKWIGWDLTRHNQHNIYNYLQYKAQGPKWSEHVNKEHTLDICRLEVIDHAFAIFVIMIIQYF